jgi:hypothetical protein
MINVIRLVITVVFGFLWWWVYNRVGASLQYLMILGSVLAVCVCCCRGTVDPVGIEWNWDRYFACLRRCWVVTAVLIVSLIIIAILVAWVSTGAFPPGPVLVNIIIAAIGAPLFIRLICCAYDS